MRRKGALLVEVAIAATLVSVALIAVAQLVIFASQQQRSTNQRSLALQLAANSLERGMGQTWDKVTNEELALWSLPADTLNELPEGKLECAVIDTPGSVQSKQITATVSWRTHSGVRERVILSSWIFRREVQP